MTSTVEKQADTDFVDPGSSQASGSKHWWVLATLCIAQLMVVLDATVVNIALPYAQQDLGFGTADRQWVVTGYTLAFGSLLLLGGRLSDMFGRRAVFMIGLVGFALASAVGGAASSGEQLIGARVAQGVFGALLAPAALSLLTVTFAGRPERTKAFGVYGAIAGAGAAIGLLLGGALTEWASWRWALYINIVFAAIALVGAAVLLGRHTADRKVGLDLSGTVTATAGLFSVVYGFAHAETDGWSNTITLAFLAAGVVLLAAFVVLQTRVENPLLPLRVVLDRTRASAYLAVFFLSIGLFAIFLFLTYYLEQILGYSPLHTGVAILPLVVALVISATVGSSVFPRVGAKVSVAGGLLIGAVGLVSLTQIGLHTGYTTHVLPGLVLIGFGLGAVMTVSFQAATAGIDRDDAGVASAMVNTSQQIGGSIGTALLSTFAASTASNYLAGRASTATAVAQSQVESYITTFWWAAGFLAVGAVVVVVLMPHKIPAATDGEPVLAL